MVPAFLAKATKCVNAAPAKGVSSTPAGVASEISFIVFIRNRHNIYFNLITGILHVFFKEWGGSLQTQRETA